MGVKPSHSQGNTAAAGSEQQQHSLLACRLVLLAAGVRAAYLLLVVGFAHLIRDYDTSASLLSESCADNWPEEAAVAQQYTPGTVWDSVFLHRVSACGYEYEQFFAFYPGLPGTLAAVVCLPAPCRVQPPAGKRHSLMVTMPTMVATSSS